MNDIRVSDIGVGLLIAACLWGSGFFAGTRWEHGKHEVKALSATVAQSEAARATEQKQAAATQTASQKTTAAAVAIHKQTDEVIRYVPYVIPADSVRRYPLSDGFVRVVDAAITGETDRLASSPGRVDDGPSAVTPDAGATILAQNFGICREAIDRNKQWQAWAVEAGLSPNPEQEVE